MVLALAAVFAVINGANDGGAMLASTLKVPGLRVLSALAVYAAALVAVPIVLGTGVADTLTSGLVDVGKDEQAALVAMGVVAAILVAGALTALGLPTSLTLAVVGGIVGAGIGRGLPVQVSMVGRVIAIGLAAPVVGGVLALVGARGVAWALALTGARGLVMLRRLATLAQAIAYAANDGQKMFAVVAVSALGVTPPVLVVVALLFVLGCVLGVTAAAGTLGGRIMRTGPREETTAQLSASVAVLASAALGAPVSMTQAVSGGLVGTGVLRGMRQVRWRIAGQLVVAWIITLPTAALIGMVIASSIGRLT